MAKYTAGEIHFNLMALIQDRTVRYNSQLKEVASLPADVQASEIARIEMMLADEENKRAKWRIENMRRRHNYLPLIMELLRSLATRGELVPIYQKAKEKASALAAMGSGSSDSGEESSEESEDSEDSEAEM